MAVTQLDPSQYPIRLAHVDHVYLVELDGGEGGETLVHCEDDDKDALRDWAVAWAEGGDWDAEDDTVWVSLEIWSLVADDDTAEGYRRDETVVSERVAIDPPEPECCEDWEEHDWQSPHEVVGGMEENPGVWGDEIREVCAHCGAYRVTDTWAQDRDTGEQGLTSVRYEDADSASTEWVESLRAEAEEEEEDDN